MFVGFNSIDGKLNDPISITFTLHGCMLNIVIDIFRIVSLA